MISPIDSMIDEACGIKGSTVDHAQVLLDVADAAIDWLVSDKYEGTDEDLKLAGAITEWLKIGG